MLMVGAAVLAAPHIAKADSQKVLRFVPRWGLAQLDPVVTTDAMTRQFGIMVFESLYAVDEVLNPRPQMVEGHVIEDDGKRWTMRLREGLRFHDGEPVLARDCVASIKRWLARDLLAQSLRPRLDKVEALDDQTLVFRLNRPFPRLDFALGKAQPNILPVMPERLAVNDPVKPVGEVIGSGPFRFLSDQFKVASFAAFEAFENYSPRNEPANGTAGGRRARVARVEWNTIPDPGTAAAALMTGEVDWIDSPLADLLPRLRQSSRITVDVIDRFGFTTMLRLNHASGPTANLGVRQAIMAAIDQSEIMHAVTGGDTRM
jgi:peptide/nickel transport system substrate-binding protein